MSRKVFENGRAIKKARLTKKAPDANNRSTQTNSTNSGSSCETFLIREYERICIMVKEGDEPAVEQCEWVATGVYWYEEICPGDSNCPDGMSPEDCACMQYSLGCEGNEDENGDGDNPNNNLVSTDVINQLQSDCFKTVFNLIGNPKLEGFIFDLFRKTFVGNNMKFNLLMQELPNLTDPVTGLPADALSNKHASYADTYVIVLNSSRNALYTQEYWAQIMLHEVIHAFIKFNGIDFTGGSGFTQAHMDMLIEWVPLLEEALIELGIDSDDALALSLQGINDILKDEASGQFLQDMSDWVWGLYGIDPADALDQIYGYMDKSKGNATNCQ